MVILLQPGERQYPGQVHVTIGPLRTNLTFERKDSTMTLLKDDQVLINLLTDIVTEKRRATNIRPKIPATFSNTKETRETVSALGFYCKRSSDHKNVQQVEQQLLKCHVRSLHTGKSIN